MAEEIGFENGRNSNFQGLVTLTLTLDSAIRHTVVHHSSTSTYIPNFIEIKEFFCGRTDVRTDGRTYGRTFFPPLILLGRLLEVDLIMCIYVTVSLCRVGAGTILQQYATALQGRLSSGEVI